MTWVLIIAVAWLVISVVAALLIAGTIRLADQRREGSERRVGGNFTVDLHAVPDTASSPARLEAAAEAHRPVPPARMPGVPGHRPTSERATGTHKTGTR